MKDAKLFFKQLTNFLNLKQTDKRDLVNWYDLISEGGIVDEEQLSITEKKAKIRLLSSIRRDRTLKIKRYVLQWSVAATLVFALGFFGLRYFGAEELASNTLLAEIGPAQERAVILLDNGKEIDLDQLRTNQQVQIGESIITKDAQGQIRYLDAKSGKEKVQINSLRVPKGATYRLTLTDGTKVMLNSDSKLTYPSSFGDGDRIVKLEGEAYFQVTKTTTKSRFIVESKQQKVQVLGTTFNVKSYTEDKQTETTLVEGTVNVGGHNELAVKNRRLKPSEQAVFTASGIDVHVVNVADVLSWVDGQFCFDGTNTEAVLQEIARWYDVDVQYERKGTAAQYKGKIPRDLPLNQFVELLNYAELKTKALVGSNKRINLLIN
ncbi:FecR family protein [Sphingobacterium psychroaquaticum]|uniref:FecR family protein n=1 Tax=Sphingobacterium psychroaquaticum TaxID=561061 RepID=A0A1X7K4L2_9SPHI|nr:FecR family protein [Sphingobacterium psychroaquaticum]SMG35904.1 FecR family protein [Sphingobacterium psychroaquaticum]